jgi:hypothetical protein
VKGERDLKGVMFGMDMDAISAWLRKGFPLATETERGLSTSNPQGTFFSSKRFIVWTDWELMTGSSVWTEMVLARGVAKLMFSCEIGGGDEMRMLVGREHQP